MKTITQVLDRLLALSPLYLGVLLFVLALVVRVAIIVHFRPYNDLARYELERTAISLAQTGVYGNPYALPTGPTAHVSPGYTLILAALFRVFGTGTSAEIVKELLATCVTCLQIALLPAVARILCLDKGAGFFAGLVMALYPARPMVEVDGDWETPYIALALMLIAALATHIWTERNVSLSRAALHGVLWGICLLFVAALLPLFVAFVVFDSFWHRNQFKRRIAYAITELAVAAACLAPWVIRNEIALGSPIVTRTNSGIELRVSNNDSAVADQRVNAINGLFDRYHPLQSSAEALKVRQFGEVEYNRRAMQEARQWIREHPQRFLQLTLGRIRLFWLFVDPTSRMKTGFLWLVSLLGFAGLLTALVRTPMAGIILGAIALVYPIPNYLVHVTLRQSYPLEWLLLLLGCALFTSLFTPERKDAHRMQTAWSLS